jgi:hypothetical protein
VHGENGTPITPDWIPESRDGSSVRPQLRPSLSEALRLWDQDWAHWDGDDS